MLWLSAAALLVCLLMTFGLVGWIGYRGLPAFWPGEVVRITTVDGRSFMGEPDRAEAFDLDPATRAGLPEPVRAAADAAGTPAGGRQVRRLFRTGNYELFGSHYQWVADFEIAEEERPDWAVVVERTEWGRFYGFPSAAAELLPIALPGGAEARAESARLLASRTPPAGATPALHVRRRVDGRDRELLLAPAEVGPDDLVLAAAFMWRGAEVAWRRFEARHAAVLAERDRARALREDAVGAVSEALEDARLRLREAALRDAPPAAWVAAHQQLRIAQRDGDPDAVQRAGVRLRAVEREIGRPAPAFLELVAEVEEVERRADVEFAALSAEIAALESAAGREVLQFTTARDGIETTIAIADVVRAYPANQLGLAARVGVYLDRWGEFLLGEPREANTEGGVFPAIFGTVLMTLLMCLVVVPFGVLAALYLREFARPGTMTAVVRIAVNNLAGVPSIVFGVFGLGFFCYIVGASIDELFYAARLPQPTFGKGGLLWAALTLALMTVPVVIVATEEALAAVPGSLREGSCACGATRWQTIRRIVLPRAAPSILTGAILAMARGAGEVAPLMLVGAVKLAQELPIELEPPFGINRSFMHLGFHVYDLGFQSQNSEAALGMVYTTTLLLIAIIATLNGAAILLRARLRRRLGGTTF
jgi:phosphate ABC transporter permease subunit PstA